MRIQSMLIAGLAAVLMLSASDNRLGAQTVTVFVERGFDPAVPVNRITTASLRASSTRPTPPAYCDLDPESVWTWSWQVVSPPPDAHVMVIPSAQGHQHAKVKAFFDRPGDYTITIRAHVRIGSSCGQFWEADGTLGTTPSDPSLLTKAIDVQINLSAGQYVGAVRDPLTLPLQAQPAPALSGETFSWSVKKGPGSGDFDTPSAQAPNFHGTVEGHVTTQVAMTYQGATCHATQELIVVRIDDLTKSVDREMDQIPMSEGDSYFVPFSGAEGELRSVLVAATEDPANPYRWETDYFGRVNHVTGDVVMTFVTAGPYLLEINRANGSTYVELWVNSATSNEGKEKSCKTKAIPRPSADLLLISSSTNDNGFLANARTMYGVGNYTPIASVKDAIKSIGNMPMVGSVALIDHGRSALQDCGAGNSNSVGETLYLSEIGIEDTWTEQFMAACRPKVVILNCYGCSVAAGAKGKEFVKKLASGGGMTATAWDKTIHAIYSPRTGGRWAVCDDATLVTRAAGVP